MLLGQRCEGMLQDIISEDSISRRAQHTHACVLNIVLVVFLVISTFWTLIPAAKLFIAVPKLENEARVSVALSIAPTVMVDGAEAGESFNAYCYLMSASKST